MEEKERYEVHIYDDVCVDLYDNGVLDKSVNDTHKLENLLNQQDKQIKELEEQTYPAYKREHKRRAYLENIEVPRLEKENQQLKQQLAEKDKEIEHLKKFDDLNKTFFNLFRIAVKEPDKVDDLFNTIKTMQEKQDQNKISFAVEWLEKVRTQFLTNYSWYQETHRVCEKTDNFVIWLDNQIKRLKEKK